MPFHTVAGYGYLMVTCPPSPAGRIATYPNGQPYSLARGRYAPRSRIDDRFAVTPPVVQGCPSAADFLENIVRKLRIRFYQPKAVRSYRNALQSFLRWFGGAPHQVTREDVREFLLYLVDAGASSSWASINLSAIRTAFDKMCGRSVTLGLATPRRPKRLPVVLSVEEVGRLLQAAPSLHDKLLLGLMYATGVRVSEVVRLRYRDVDFDRRLINVWQGKGRSDRQRWQARVFHGHRRQRISPRLGHSRSAAPRSMGRASELAFPHPTRAHRVARILSAVATRDTQLSPPAAATSGGVKKKKKTLLGRSACARDMRKSLDFSTT
jgi:hypothetical protein